jgi:hypothetical protein
VQAEVRTKAQESLDQMKAKGLTVVQPENLPEWQNALKQVQGVVRGKVVAAATFDRVIALRDEYRAAKKAGTTPGATPTATPAPAPAAPADAQDAVKAKKGSGKHK